MPRFAEFVDPADGAAVAGCDAVWRAASAADNPLGSRMSAPVLAVWLRYSFSGDPAETWFVRAPGTGDIVGWYRLELPDLENVHHAGLLISVHPASRRRGFGGALLRHAAGAGATPTGWRMSSTPTRTHRTTRASRRACLTPTGPGTAPKPR